MKVEKKKKTTKKTSSAGEFLYDDVLFCSGVRFFSAFFQQRFFYCVRGAIHAYEDAYFFSVNDAFIYRGGREGLFKSSKEEYNGDDWGVKRPGGLANGKSYILV